MVRRKPKAHALFFKVENPLKSPCCIHRTFIVALAGCGHGDLLASGSGMGQMLIRLINALEFKPGVRHFTVLVGRATCNTVVHEHLLVGVAIAIVCKD